MRDDPPSAPLRAFRFRCRRPLIDPTSPQSSSRGTRVARVEPLALPLTHTLRMSPGSWLAAWHLAEDLATAERYAMAMSVAADLVASHLLPSPRQSSRSKPRGRGGMSGSRLAQPRVRKLWQYERARRPARGVLRSSTVRPRQPTPAPCPRQLTPAPCPRQRPPTKTGRTWMNWRCSHAALESCECTMGAGARFDGFA